VLIAVLLPLCIFLVCSIAGLSGVHFPGDVIWGCTEGILVLFAYIGLKPRAAAWLGARPLLAHVAMAIGAASVVVALNLLFLTLILESPLPAATGPVYAGARAQAFKEASAAAGLILGLWVGLALEGRYVRFTTAGPLRQRALRYGLGLAGLLAIGLGLLMIQPGGRLALALALQVVGAATAALWAVFIWPWLFVRVRLGTAERPA
jgi:hypothetical protein